MNGYVQQLKISVDRQTVLFAFLGALVALGTGLIIAERELKGAVIILLIPMALAVVFLCLYRPKLGLFIYLQYAFIVNGIQRFSPVVAPYGLLADGLLLLLLIGVVINYKQFDWKNLHNPAFYLILFWTLYTFLQLFNTELPVLGAWFFAVRAESLYWFQLTILGLVLIRTKKDIDTIFTIWLIWSVVAAIWAFRQRYIGLTAGEQQWLDAGASVTHVLFGQLRCFSFYSDAGQFGAEMAYATLLCIIRVLDERVLRVKLLYLGIGLIVFWGFAVSGTRGALFVILAGLPVYIILRRNFAILIIGILIGGSLFGMLKYTSIGSSLYEIERMRTALDPENDSFQVRLDNQKKLVDYLATRPFGGGIGSSGDWARRFTPNSFLAATPPDSWYVKIWIENGIVGLVIHLGMLLFFLALGIYNTTRPELATYAPDLKLLLLSLICGYAGILVACYGNPIFGQFPTNSIMSITIVLLCSTHVSRAYIEQEKKQVLQPQVV
ncbi:O-antigen ligase family protein [Spirosoma linguale]|uniref:O-antigen polymerase n=1 Tax=Spirosoma linguale (strain ATCC 33905 / DSM 74 / LMG 10896 / Claus 1) TaxID=504472 RepID=D2QHQ1_SPILD|nr:O-antigen polymerase [Spirosoma linguale DSM 74]